jgi:hypothetical protein
MSRSVRAVTGHRTNHRPAEHAALYRRRLGLVFGCPLIVVAVGFFTMQTRDSRAGIDSPIGAMPQVENASRPSHFAPDCRVSLKQLHEKLAGLGTEGLATNEPTADDIALQVTQVEVAKVGVQRALLLREAAEIALKEYQEGVFPQEKKACESEMEMAQAKLESADRAVPEARQRYARFRHVKTGSTADLAREWRLEAGETVAQLRRKSAQLALEQAQSKLKMLVAFEHLRNVKDLASNVEKTRSEELARRATLGLEQAKLKKLERLNDPTASRRLVSDDRKQILELLARAIPLEDQLSSRLDQIKEYDQPAESVRTEITRLTRELQEIVVRANDAGIAAAMGRLKSGLRRAKMR